MLRLLACAILAGYAIAQCPCDNWVVKATSATFYDVMPGWEPQLTYGPPNKTSSGCAEEGFIGWSPSASTGEVNITLQFATRVQADQIQIRLWMNAGANVNFSVMTAGTDGEVIGSHLETKNCSICGEFVIPLNGGNFKVLDTVILVIDQTCGRVGLDAASLDSSSCCTTSTSSSTTSGTDSTSSSTSSTSSSATTGSLSSSSTTTTSSSGSSSSSTSGGQNPSGAPVPTPSDFPTPSGGGGCDIGDYVCMRDCIIIDPSKVPNPTKQPTPSKDPNPTKYVEPKYYTVEVTYPCGAEPDIDCCEFYDALPDATSSDWELCSTDSAADRRPSYDPQKGECTVFMYAQAGESGIDDAAFQAAQDSVEQMYCQNATASECDIKAKDRQSLRAVYAGSTSAVAASILLLSCMLATLV